MEWFELRPNSIAALAELMLSFVLTLYLLSIRKKSRDGWLITAMFLLPTLYHTAAFIYYSTDQAPWNNRLVSIQVLILAFITVFNLWFAYIYRENPFRREMKLVLPLSVGIIAIGLYFHTYTFPVTFHIYLVIYAWIVLLFMRKALWAAYLPNVEGNLGDPKVFSLRNIITQFRSPSNRESKAYRALAIWSLVFFMIWLNVNLAVSGVLGYDLTSIWWALPHHVLLLIRLTWLVISYINYASEHTTFVAKLVGVFLCLTLVLLGMLGFLLYGFESINKPGDEHVQHALEILAFLIPGSTFIIVLVFPIFFRINLLRPLNYVLDGVQRVNAGDLTVKVPIEVRDEFGMLGHHFNRMTGSLRRYTLEMESLVMQRTMELEHQKAELQATLKNLKATQDQLIQKEKMASLGELTAGIAHEIQNPLNFVNNFSEVSEELVQELEQDLGNGSTTRVPGIMADLKQSLEKIHTHGKRAESIVKGMLQHSRASSGERQLTDLNTLADEYLRLSYHGLRAKDKTFNAQLVTDLDPDLGKVEVVPQEIGRVLLNLFNNAFYATQEKKNKGADPQYRPEVRVTTRKFGKKVEIRVRDNGGGIPAQVLDKIFQPFFTTKAAGEGTGLGLSLSYDIITKGHGGELKVETQEGEYSEFIISLPQT